MTRKVKHRLYMRRWSVLNPEKKAKNDANSYRRHRGSRLKKAAKYRREHSTKIKAWWKRNRKIVYHIQESNHKGSSL